jgi:hypothetical protein
MKQKGFDVISSTRRNNSYKYLDSNHPGQVIRSESDPHSLTWVDLEAKM